MTTSDLNWKTLVHMYYNEEKQAMIQTYHVKNALVTLENGIVTRIKTI